MQHDWNPPGIYQLCNCYHEKAVHGDGDFWTSCQADECECSKYTAASQSPEAKAKFREEMDAGERCKQCGHMLYGSDCMWCRSVSGGPVCNYPGCGHEQSLMDVLRRHWRQLVRRG